VKVLGPAPAPRAERHATALLHDEANVRVVAFRLERGQEVPAHSSPATVLVHVLAGRGTFTGADDAAAELASGESAIYAPGEPHAIKAGAEGVAFLAVIAPRPS
jgi:quercetin dioxygenase-like cupin family protein